MEIIQSFLTNNPYYTKGKKIEVKGLMLHSVGCPQPNAQVFIKQWDKPDYTRACIHGFIDGNSGTVYQTLPWDYRAPHCGGAANNTHIGVEMCEPGCIKYTGGASFTCSDRDAAMAVVERTYHAAVELFAKLCGDFGLNPLQDGVIISHKEGHDRGLSSGHGDPDHLWKGMQCGFSMDGFRRDVAKAMGSPSSKMEQTEQKVVISEQTAQPASEKAEVGAGDLVRLLPGAVYYDGKAMPDWVLADKWFVKSVSGDRVVIDWNEGKTKAISSPVNAAYVERV